MLEQYCRQGYQTMLVDPVAKVLPLIIKPVHVTLFAGLAGVLMLPVLLMGYPVLSICLLLLSGYADTLDGTLARLRHQAGMMGSVLDILVDRLVESTVVVALFLLDPSVRGLMALLMLGSMLLCVTSFLVVGVFTPNNGAKGFYYSAGMVERAEAFIMFILMIMLPSYFQLLSVVFVMLVLLTTIIRVLEFARYATCSAP